MNQFLNKFVGIGLRHPHYQAILDEKPNIGWLEVHSENFFYQDGPAKEILLKIREHYPVSLHGVGLSLGSVESINKIHLKLLKELIERVEPFLVSEHLSWSRAGGKYLPDLLPVPYTQASLDVFSRNIDETQNFLKREILIENPSSYLEYACSDMQEADFLVKLAEKTGAKILLDVNNIFVSCSNHGWDSNQYLQTIPEHLVKEIHLAGHSLKKIKDEEYIRVDTHDAPVCPEVWALYDKAIERFGQIPSLLERDAHIPPLSELIQEASKMASYHAVEEVNS